MPMPFLRWKLPRPLHYYSPSQKDGMPLEKDYEDRIKLIKVFRKMSTALSLSEEHVIPTAVVFLHRVLTVLSLQTHSITELGCAILFLAAKVESSPRRLSDFIKHFLKVPLEGNDVEHNLKRQEVMKLEREVITALGFEFSITHPHKHFDRILNEVIEGLMDTTKTQARQCVRELYWQSMNFPLCLQFTEVEIASSLVYVALHSMEGQLSHEDDSKLRSYLCPTLLTPPTLHSFCTQFKSLCGRFQVASLCQQFEPTPGLLEAANATLAAASPIYSPGLPIPVVPPPPPPLAPCPSGSKGEFTRFMRTSSAGGKPWGITFPSQPSR